MKRTLLAIAFTIGCVSGADDSWTKQRSLKSGTEVRVYKRGTTAPIVGKLDEVKEDSIVLVVKDAQVAIDKDDVDRLDARPVQTTKRVIREGKTEVREPRLGPGTPGLEPGLSPPETHSSGGLTFGGKAEFETVYRRAVGAPKKTEIK